MRALVTGGAGFIGSHLTGALVAAGHQARVLDDLSTGHVGNVPDGAELIEGSVADAEAVARAASGVDVIFHQAARSSVARSVNDPLATDTANVHGTLTVLKVALDAAVPRVVYASSSSVYGGAEQLPTPETVPVHPRSPYAVSKLAGELYCRTFAELHGLQTVALRYFNVFGPRQRPDSAYAAAIPLFVDALRRGVSPTVHGDGRQSRDFTFVEDVVAANLAAAAAPAAACAGQPYNVGAGGQVSLLELLATLGHLLEVEPRPVHTEPRKGDVRHSSADIGAARRHLGYDPRFGLEEGLRRTLAWSADAATTGAISGD